MNREDMQALYNELCDKADEGSATETQNEQRIALCHALDPDMQDTLPEWAQLHPELFSPEASVERTKR